jgi:general secretion pathway protein B
MSYILDALKKSQQERELGRVPTLDTPGFAAEGAVVSPTHWGAAAVALAALAVVIALYAALRGAPPAGDGSSGITPTAEQTAAVPAEVPTSTEPRPLPAPPASGTPVTTVAPIAAPPALGKRPPSPASPPGAEAPPSAVASVPEPTRAAAVPPSRAVIDDAPEPEPAPAVSPGGAMAVPEDLRQDIEAFKEQVRQERSGGKKPAKRDAKVRPQDLRLPRDVAERMPAFLMTVHIYDTDPPKRFVLINARKIREGGSTRDGIQVEQILPDGAVLSYDGHRFFQHR